MVIVPLNKIILILVLVYRCSNESDVGPVEIARRESQHFLHNTDIIVSQRDETRQLSKELIAQVTCNSLDSFILYAERQSKLAPSSFAKF